MKIVYTRPDDLEQFDATRYLNSLRSYDPTVSMEDIDNALIGNTGLLHVSCLVSKGVEMMKDEDAAKRYYDDHSDWFDMRNFERLRRITGYLVGTVDRWNDGKKAELKERVKHSVAGVYSRDEKGFIEAEKANVYAEKDQQGIIAGR